MTLKERGAKVLHVKADLLKEFEVEDVFNGNTLRGVICRKSDHRYGALVLFYVNEEPCEQIIWATPKLDYPFDGQGNFRWPRIQQVSLYDKLDGTNIVAYHYEHMGRDYVTYKTRLTPIIRGSDEFGDFLGLWKECLEENQWIADLIAENPEYNLSFELYGSRNKHMVNYDVGLDTAFLFGVRRADHVVKPPEQLKLVKGVKLPEFFECESAEDLTAVYQAHVDDLTAKLDGMDPEDFILEGMIMYAKVEGQRSWRQFKLKADQVRSEHWAASGYIHKMDILATAMNAYEHTDDPKLEDVIELLAEEYPKQKIDKSLPRIEKMYKKARRQVQFLRDINKVYAEARASGFDITQNKDRTLRFMSKFFRKKEMKMVGSVILQQAGLIEPKTKKLDIKKK